MSTIPPKKTIYDGLIVGSFLALLVFFGGLDRYMPAPGLDSMEEFSGRVSKLYYYEQSRRWYVHVDSDTESRKFYFPLSVCDDLSDKVDLGSDVTALLHRRFGWFGDIRGWTLRTQDAEAVSFGDSVSLQKGNLFDFLKFLLVLYPMFCVLWVFFFWSKERNTKSA